jgi:prepilin-type N-terminal cleavage/methylation domain-containing protein
LKAEKCPRRFDLFHGSFSTAHPIHARFGYKNGENHAVARRLLMGDAMLTKATKTSSRAFTLVELMTVVMIVGVLATVATYGVRKYVLSAKKAEAVSMLTQIRAAEEAYRDEMFVYLGGNNLSVWHPSASGQGKRSWDFSPNAMTAFFDQLGVRSDGPVGYSYTVFAGVAGTALPTSPMNRTVAFPAATGPYYIAMARADLNGDGSFTYAVCHSDSSEIYVEDDTF